MTEPNLFFLIKDKCQSVNYKKIFFFDIDTAGKSAFYFLLHGLSKKFKFLYIISFLVQQRSIKNDLIPV